MGSRICRLWLGTLACLAVSAAFLFGADESRPLPASPAAAALVGLRVPPTGAERGYDAALPVEVRELTPRSSAEAAGAAGMLPEGFAWRDSGGTFLLVRESDPAGVPCRAFALGLPAEAARGLLPAISAALPRTYRDAELDVVLKTMAVAVIQSSDGNPRGFFPVPFSSRDSRPAPAFTLAGLKTSFPAEVNAATRFKVDLLAPILLRELVRRDFVPLASAQAALRGQSPYAALSEEAKAMAAGTVAGRSLGEVLADLLGNWLDARHPRLEVLSLPLELGRIGGGSAASRTVELAGRVVLAGTPAATGPAFGVGFGSAARPGGQVDFDGFAWPTVDGTGIDLSLSARSLTSHVQTRIALARQLLRGWRWNQMLTASAGAPAQTLFRLNEPLWEFLVARTVRQRVGSGVGGASDSLDAVDRRILDGRAEKAKAVASRADEALQGFIRHGLRGEAADGFYPAGDRLDHEMCQNLLGAFEGAGGASALLAGTRGEEAGAARARARFARRIARLVSEGFTRPSTTVPAGRVARAVLRAAGVAGADRFPSSAAGSVVATPVLQPDLVWLERAVQAASPAAATLETGPLAHLLGEFQGTRLQKALSELVGSKNVRSMQWQRRPTIAEGTRGYLFYRPGASQPALRDALLEAATRPPQTSVREAQLSTPVLFAYAQQKVAAPGALPDEAWFARFTQSRPASQPTTAGDTRTYHYVLRKDRIAAAATALKAAAASVAANTAVALALRFDSRGTSFGLVPPAGRTLSNLERAAVTAFEAGADLAGKMAELDGKPAATARGDYYSARAATVLVPAEELLGLVWEGYLAGADFQKPSSAASYVELLARLRAIAKLAGTGLTIRTADGKEQLLQ